MKRARLLLVLGSLALGTTALAYTTVNSARWKDARTTMYYDPQWVGFGSYITELHAAMGPWSNVEGSNFVMSSGGASPSANLLSGSNGNNDVYFMDLSPSVYAITWILSEGPDISDRDVEFNTDWNWSTGTGTGSVDFRSVAIHEFGHVAGLGHETARPAVMRPYYDGTSLEHRLYFDDEEGCRFMYPAPPPEPAPITDTDLLIENVRFSPSDVRAGQEIRISFDMRNIGTDPTGAFAATAYLSDYRGVTTNDRYLRAAAQSNLDPGASRSASIAVRLPEVLEPRDFYVGVILDAQLATGDRNRSNNSDVASETITGGGDAIMVGLGNRVAGTLESLGRRSFTLELTEGTRVQLKAKMPAGTLELRAFERDTGRILFQNQRFKKAGGKFTAAKNGTYVIQIDNHNAGFSDYELRIGGRTVTHKGTMLVTNARQVHVPGYRGCKADVLLKSKSEARPTAEWADLQAVLKSNKKGTKVRLKPTDIFTTGPLVLALSRGEGPPGDINYRIRVKVPKKGPLIRDE